MWALRWSIDEDIQPFIEQVGRRKTTDEHHRLNKSALELVLSKHSQRKEGDQRGVVVDVDSAVEKQKVTSPQEER